mmetsp:Transcript_21490/g.44175  ORF Transcript_21490/g.44175 Transcript_21490/m.44175 type:complete len:146 (-) Transcript_21490:670-1107(-)
MRPLRRRRHDDRQIGPGIIVLPLVKHRAIFDVLLVQLGKHLSSSLTPQYVTRRTGKARQSIVEFEHQWCEDGKKGEKPMSEWRGPNVPFREGTHDGYPIGQMPLRFQHVLPFLMAVKHHFEFGIEGFEGGDGGGEEVEGQEGGGG